MQSIDINTNMNMSMGMNMNMSMNDYPEYQPESLLDTLEYLGLLSPEPVIECRPGAWVLDPASWVVYNPVPRPSGAVLEACKLDSDGSRLILRFGIDGAPVATLLDGAPISTRDAFRRWLA